MSEHIQYPRLISYVARGRDEHGWWRQDEPDGPKIYDPEVEAQVRAVLPDWMIDEAEAAMNKKNGNGDEASEVAQAAREAKEEQEAFKRTHAARERSRQARVKARDEKKGEDK